MNKQKAYNKHMESQNLRGTPTARRKKYAAIVKEMGVRGITLSDIAHDEKQQGFYDMMKECNMTLDERVVLQQYSKAIIDRDTRAAEFLRDTAGEKPSTQLEVTGDENGLSKMSLDELRELKRLLIHAKEE